METKMNDPHPLGDPISSHADLLELPFPRTVPIITTFA
jgi:hypothetical protein